MTAAPPKKDLISAIRFYIDKIVSDPAIGGIILNKNFRSSKHM
jgi:hypothetical protein